jgi:hypothetical protein
MQLRNSVLPNLEWQINYVRLERVDMISNPCSLISTHTKCAQIYPLLKSRARTYKTKQRPFPPNLTIFCYSYILSNKEHFNNGGYYTYLLLCRLQHGGSDSIFLQSILVVRWTKWQWCVFFRILEFPSVSIIPSVLHSHRRHTNPANDSFFKQHT